MMANPVADHLSDDSETEFERIIGLDVRRARSVCKQTRAKSPAPAVHLPVANVMVVGNQAVGELFDRYARTAQVLAEHPFFEKFEITDSAGASDAIYVAKVATLDLAVEPDDSSTLVGWTARLPTKLKDTEPGKEAEIAFPKGRTFVCSLHSRASFDGGLV